MLINKISKNIFIKILNIDHGFLVIKFPDNTKLTFGDKNSDIIGKLNIYILGDLKKEVDILAYEDIDRSNVFSRIFKSLNYLVWGDV